LLLFYYLPMSTQDTRPLVLSFEAARHAVEQHASKIVAPETETVATLAAANRILAEPIHADRDLPPFPRSTRDGYAVRSSDLTALPAKLKLIGEIKAGSTANPRPINPGETYSIMTGASVAPGADSVVMVEHTLRQGDCIEIGRSVARGENIIAQGAEARYGSLLLDRGARLNDSAAALAATVGKSKLKVFVRPRVAILTTGDEILDIDQTPGPTQIRNSNSYSLAVQIRQAGGVPTLLPIAPDEPNRLRELIEEGLASHLLIMTGGVSMGRYDLVEQVLAELRGEFFFTGAKIQPGRPVVFGRVPGGAGAPERAVNKNGAPEGALARRTNSAYKYFFGLPGNPVSTMVTFELFARPMLEALTGMKPRPLMFLHAPLKFEIRIKPGLTRFLPAILSGEFAKTQIELVAWQGSGDIAAQSRANCYVVLPPDRELISSGEWVAILPR
jgi:molybdopterin molybdotransferase